MVYLILTFLKLQGVRGIRLFIFPGAIGGKVMALTAYNMDVQRFIMGNGQSTTAKKTTILEAIETAVIATGKSFEKLFPAKTKRRQVMDDILFMVSGSGICKVGAKKLAERNNCSVRTVGTAVKHLEETGEILVAKLADGNNKYIFIYKKHPNFIQILKEVFYLDEAQISDVISEGSSEHISELKNSESIGAVSVESEKSTSNYNNLNNLKQEKNIIKHTIERDLKMTVKDRAIMRQKLENEYAANEFQLRFYDEIQSFPFPAAIQDQAGILSLRLGLNGCADRQGVIRGIQVLSNMAKNMMAGVEIDNVVAVFSKGLESGIGLVKADKQHKQAPEKPTKPPVQFYNWLEERY